MPNTPKKSQIFTQVTWGMWLIGKMTDITTFVDGADASLSTYANNNSQQTTKSRFYQLRDILIKLFLNNNVSDCRNVS